MTAITLIGHLEVTGATQAELEFSSISQDYDDLLLVCSVRTNHTPDGVVFLNYKINGTQNNAGRYLYGLNTTRATSATSEGVATGANASSDLFGLNSFYIANYSSTSKYKAITIDGGTGGYGTTSGFQIMAHGIYQSNTAITSLSVTDLDASLVQYSQASLYGISRGSDGSTSVSIS